MSDIKTTVNPGHISFRLNLAIATLRSQVGIMAAPPPGPRSPSEMALINVHNLMHLRAHALLVAAECDALLSTLLAEMNAPPEVVASAEDAKADAMQSATQLLDAVALKATSALN